MPKLLILEGPDGSGKTTMARKYEAAALAEALTVITIHAGSPEKGQFSLLPMFMPAIEALTTHDLVIMDRSPLSEVVYAKVLRGGKTIGHQWEWAMWNRFANHNVDPELEIVRVILDAPDDQLLDRAYNRPGGETFVPVDKYFEIVAGYRTAMMILSEYGWQYAEMSDG